MSKSSKSILADKFNGFLDRYTPPRHMLENEVAQQEEVNMLFKAFVRLAPAEECGQWADRVLERLGMSLRTRAWPNAYEVLKAAEAETAVKAAPGRGSPDHQEAVARQRIAARMERGEPVGEGWFYGRLAVELLSSGLVTEETLNGYRKTWFQGLKRDWGEGKALQLQADAQARHARAEGVADE